MTLFSYAAAAASRADDLEVCRRGFQRPPNKEPAADQLHIRFVFYPYAPQDLDEGLLVTLASEAPF
jgi:hypothetical protein